MHPLILRGLHWRPHRLTAWARQLAHDLHAVQMVLLDDEVIAHLNHGPLCGDDLLTDSMFNHLEAPAAEGALPTGLTASATATATTTATTASEPAQGLTPAQRQALGSATDDSWLLWLAPAGFLVALASSAANALAGG